MNTLVFLIEHGLIRVNLYLQNEEEKTFYLQKIKYVKVDSPILLDPLFDIKSFIEKLFDQILKEDSLEKENSRYEVINKSLGDNLSIECIDTSSVVDVSWIYSALIQSGEVLFKPFKNLNEVLSNIEPDLNKLQKVDAQRLLNYLISPPLNSDDKLISIIFKSYLSSLIKDPLKAYSIILTGSFISYCKDETQVLYALLNGVGIPNNFDIYVDKYNLYYETQFLKSKYLDYSVNNKFQLEHLGSFYKINPKNRVRRKSIIGEISIQNELENLKFYPAAEKVMRIPLKVKSHVNLHFHHGFSYEGKKNYFTEVSDSLIIDTRSRIDSDSIINDWYDELYVHGF